MTARPPVIININVGSPGDSSINGDLTVASFRCPITLDVIAEPVVAEDGHTYERNAIERWLQRKQTSPVTNLPMGLTLIPNRIYRSLIPLA